MLVVDDGNGRPDRQQQQAQGSAAPSHTASRPSATQARRSSAASPP
ncbi:MAG: hypothetical protein KBG45_11640 [Ottowia sp.]|nr:hypothetical protein [Ottowia sp.]